MSAISVLVDDISNIFLVDWAVHFSWGTMLARRLQANGIKFHFCEKAKTKPGRRGSARGIL
ncbi:hypothetical protein, partial [Mesorhizobium sp. M7A.F.Ca.CA.004.04.1.1]|uniref:hypothetical protein n=1 Tax=Mesorhizobium sp. M7A.F.Ca.CA.004.04.1.1 TaxID=2496733 RepID=UPI0019D0495B